MELCLTSGQHTVLIAQASRGQQVAHVASCMWTMTGLQEVQLGLLCFCNIQTYNILVPVKFNIAANNRVEISWRLRQRLL